MGLYRRNFTTMVDLDEIKTIRWVFLKNVKKRWEYEGMAYLFREGNIPLYGKPLGSMKENHPYLSILIPKRGNENYGINIYVPDYDIQRARKLLLNEEIVRAAAEKERETGKEAHLEFNAQALESKKKRDAQKKSDRSKAIKKLFSGSHAN